MSRQNNIPDQDRGGKDTLAFVPLFDLCNHEVGVQMTSYDCATDMLICQAMRTYCKGEEFTIHYGPRPSFELLLYSGFVLEEGANTHDSYTLVLSLNPADPLLRIKKLIVRKRLSDIPGCVVAAEGAAVFTKIITGCSHLVMTFLQYARIAVMTKEECAESMRAAATGPLAFVSSANETAALAYMKDIVSGTLKTYEGHVLTAGTSAAVSSAAGQLLKNEVWMLENAIGHIKNA